jgi:hypothetical protein
VDGKSSSDDPKGSDDDDTDGVMLGVMENEVEADDENGAFSEGKEMDGVIAIVGDEAETVDDAEANVSGTRRRFCMKGNAGVGDKSALSEDMSNGAEDDSNEDDGDDADSGGNDPGKEIEGGTIEIGA